MPDMRYLHAKDKFLAYAYDVLSTYYPDRSAFDAQFDRIPTDEEKNLFLKIASFYKFLVRDGEFLVKLDGLQQRVDYIDDTYKFVALISLIEAAYPAPQYADFFHWLTTKSKKAAFPISSQAELRSLYEAYIPVHGAAQKAVKFFLSVDGSLKDHLGELLSINGKKKTIEALAKYLYRIRSQFVHSARFTMELSATYVTRGEAKVMSSLRLQDLCTVFEAGLMARFNLSPVVQPRL